MTFSAILLALLCFQDTDKSPQSESPDRPQIEERYKVSFVTLDVVATLKKEVVTDLTLDDFEVTEDGQPVEITFFETLDYRQSTADSEQEKPLQQVILALDFESVIHQGVKRAFLEIRHFLEALDVENYRYSVNLYALDKGSLTRGFTEDLNEVAHALNRYEDTFLSDRYDGNSWDNDNPLNGGSRRSGWISSGILDKVNDYQSLLEAIDFCSQMDANMCSCIAKAIEEFVEEQRLRSERVIGELEALAYKFKDSNELKTMILVSPGFALENLHSVSELARTAGFGKCRMGTLGIGRLRMDADMQKVTHACIKNRVIFHTFDVFNKAAYSNRASIGSGRNNISTYANEMSEGLKELAHASGGTFRQVYRLKGSADKVLKQNNFFYTIGYNSPPGKPGSFREIKVTVKRKKVKVRHRQGYFGS